MVGRSASVWRHSVANLAGALVPMLVALVTIPLFLRYIGQERYGALAVIMALLGYFGFFDLGLGRAVTRKIASARCASDQDRSQVLWTALSMSFFMGLVGAIILWGGAGYLLNHVIKMSAAARQEAVAAVNWLLLALPLLLPASAMSGALQARLRFVEVNAAQMLGGVLGQLLPLAVAASGYVHLTYLVPAMVAARLITNALLYWQCRRHVPLVGRPSIDTTGLASMLSYGGWASVIALISPLLVAIDRIVIASISGARATASYAVPYDLVSRGTVISGSVYNAVFPRLAAADLETGHELAKRAAQALMLLMTPLVIIGLLLIHPFMEVWVGPTLAAQSRGVAEWLLLGVWLNALIVPYHARYLALNSPRMVALIYLVEIPIYLGMLWIGLHVWGVVGAAAAWATRVLIDTFILLRLNAVLVRTLRGAFPSALLLAVAFMAQWMLPSLWVRVGLIVVLLMVLLLHNWKIATSTLRRLGYGTRTSHAS